VVVGSIVAILGALLAVGYFLTGDRLPRHASISGVDVGGLKPDEAVAKLTAELGPRAQQPIQLTAGQANSLVNPADAGLQVDYEQSVAVAGGAASLDPRRIIAALTGGRAMDAVVVVDQAKLSAAVAKLAGGIDRKPADASLAYDGATIKTTDGRTGVSVRREATATALAGAFLHSTGPIAVPLDVEEPAITTAEVQTLVKEFAKPAVSGPVHVTVGSAGSFDVTPTMIGNSITFKPQGGTLAHVLDPQALLKNAASAVKKVELTKPRDATVRLVDGKPKIISAVNGTAVAAADLAKAVEPVLTKAGGDRRGSLKLSGAKAKFSTDDARKLGIKEVTGQFTTYFPYLPYRNINIGRAAQLINGTLLKPGEIFSLNGIVGERTRANGFTEGYVIKGGRFKKDLGGGVSQSATTTSTPCSSPG
jgi:vancomycin resistance protein YoaR